MLISTYTSSYILKKPNKFVNIQGNVSADWHAQYIPSIFLLLWLCTAELLYIAAAAEAQDMSTVYIVTDM